jgi:hypothetical protein
MGRKNKREARAGTSQGSGHYTTTATIAVVEIIGLLDLLSENEIILYRRLFFLIGYAVGAYNLVPDPVGKNVFSYDLHQ